MPTTIITGEKYLDKNPDGIEDIHSLIQRTSQEERPTLLERDINTLREKITHAVVCITDSGKLVGHASLQTQSILPEVMAGQFCIGEDESIAVDTCHRGGGIGQTLKEGLMNHYGHKYPDGVISATLHPAMKHINQKLGFREVPFPLDYYEEGRNFFVGNGAYSEGEFHELACCMFRFNPESSLDQETFIQLIAQN